MSPCCKWSFFSIHYLTYFEPSLGDSHIKTRKNLKYLPRFFIFYLSSKSCNINITRCGTRILPAKYRLIVAVVTPKCSAMCVTDNLCFSLYACSSSRLVMIYTSTFLHYIYRFSVLILCSRSNNCDL